MRPTRSVIATAIAASLALGYVLPAAAQSTDAVSAAVMASTLIGQVREAGRGVSLDGALVTVGDRQVSTDRDGSFRVSGLAPGNYRLRVDYLGYQAYESDVAIGSERGERVDVVLRSTVAADNLDRVVVHGSRDAQASALNQQRASTNYVNVVSADLLGQFPDNNIAESTQRIPGVSIERDQGEGRYVTVRGAPKEFTTVSIDGVQLANPDAGSRGVELDTIPSDVIAALEVTKALTPDMDGDAIAGNINIRTQSALDREGLTLRASLAGGKYQLGDGDNQRYNATVGNRFGADQNIGVLISGSLSKQGRFTDNVETLYQGAGAGFVPSEIQIKDYEGVRTRKGLTGRFDFRINPDHMLYLVASDANFTDREFRDNLIITLDRHVGDETAGTARATFDKELRERTYDKTIRTYNLGGEHYIGDTWKLDWQVSNSEATKTTDPRMQYIFRSTVRPQLAYDYGNYDFPSWTILGRTDAPATGVNIPEAWYGFRRLNDRYEYSEEEETALRLDLGRQQSFLGETGDIKFGVRARQRDKMFDDERYRNGSAADFAALGITMSDMLCDSTSNNFDYFLTGRRFCRDIFDKYAGQLIDSDNHVRLIPDSLTGDYSAEEDVYAGYVRLDANWGALTMIAGARYERTELEGRATQFDQDSGEALPTMTSRQYSTVLPSLHARYEFSADSILRASYSTGLNRPDFMHVAPYRILGERELDEDSDLNVRVIEEGNPLVKEAYAHSLDLSLEHYLRPLGLLSAALFYKRIDDPLFVASQDTDLGGGDTDRIIRAENGERGRIYGAELAWQQTFDMLPGAFSGLGIYANYTYAKSRAELPFDLGETELPGTSRTNYNVALTYENHKLNARLAYNYRSKFIQSFDVSNPGLNVYWDERASLDFSTSLKLGDGWSLFGEVNNIQDTRQIRFQGQRNRVLEMEGFGRSWLAGVRYQF
ncbi:TonB-dependent receptor [Luteimonas sp. 3794]|uniref:TonB-dependent receptor n=1 Tax=Luteimonas sp. 3794 TaxID=2817730 RepID=UPI0028611B13|nr:TonB-dependent receptor [Luteimonas sp. 3794]MDR6991479.1 TonB-dependent receptor [Luteimonas sp. 3794]